MASIRRTDIMQKKYSKGRPAKSERDRMYKRQEAYKWRDLRRVYLASSFDRWRKLRSSLKLKDSSLAWHLMEAHEKGHCSFCRHCHYQSTKEKGKQRRKYDQKEFLPTLISSIRQLCHTHFDFDCIEIVGLLCLEFDKARKENFSINECVRSKSPCYVSNSSAGLPDNSVQEAEVKSSLSLSPDDCQDIHKINTSELETPAVSSSTPCSAASTCTELSINTGLSEIQNEQSQTCIHEDFNVLHPTSSQPSVTLESVAVDEHPLISPLLRNGICNSSDNSCVQSEQAIEQISFHDTEPLEGTIVTCQQKLADEKCMDSSICSESEPSLEIDIENMDTSQEEDIAIQNSHKTKIQLPDPNVNSGCCFGTSAEATIIASKGLQNPEHLENVGQFCDVSKTSSRHSSELVDKDKTPACHEMKPDCMDIPLDKTPTCHEMKPDCMDLPLDMSVLKPVVKEELDACLMSGSAQDYRSDVSSPNYRDAGGSHLELLTSSSGAGKRKIPDTASVSPLSSRRSPLWLESLHTLPGKIREDGHVNIPWQRRDMSRKEEYEFLEMNPFSDLADFSQRYPHVHQRTYYRWKRRIKEEYIILEQCPGMTFQDFSSVVLQAKESVFLHWKSLIAQGKGFFAPSDAKRLESKSSLKPSLHHNSAYVFMQKNLTCTYEQFCQHYPGTPADVYNVLKRKALQEFWLFHQNKHLSHKDFSKIVNVTEDVFNAWKEYIEGFRVNSVSSNLKLVSNSLTQNQSSSAPSIYSVDSSHSLTPDLQLQSSKDASYRIKDGSTVVNESKASAHSGSLNSPLSDSVVRSLSSSYLASLQNMMFPWHSYYGLTSPLGQQMLPMMLWPGMMGLAGGLTNSIGLMSGLHGNGLPKPSSTTELHSSLLEGTESVKSDESQSNQSDEYTQSSNVLRSSENREHFRNLDTSDSEKRIKLSNDKDEGDALGSASRSRKQNKQEYIYYLKNPELCFKELESLFPSISLRTFYRWRKEMNAAVLLLEDNKDMTFCQFQMIFPDIPEDIFELWKERVSRELSPTSEKHNSQSLETGELHYSNQSTSVSDQSSAGQPKIIESDRAESLNGTADQTSVTDLVHLHARDDSVHLFKKIKEGYHYVQKNPDVDIASFTKLYPHTSARSFYRWKKELKNVLAFLRANPAMTYAEYKSIDSSITEEVFCLWKSLALDNNVIKQEIIEDGTDMSEAGIPNHNNKSISPEYWFLQLNPYIEFSQFSSTYPDISEHTFYQWKQEIHQIMNYIRSEPLIELSDVVTMLPHVSEDAFSRWKQIISAEKENSDNHKQTATKEITCMTDGSENKQQQSSQMSDALLHLMHNPAVTYNCFKVKFEFVSNTTFEQWLKRIKTVILFIASNPSIKYTSFSTYFSDIAEDVFERWKSLSSDEIAALKMDQSASDVESGIISDGQEEDNSLVAFEFCQKNPKVTFTTFQALYPTVSEKVFHGWKTKIQEQLQYIGENPHINFDDYAKVHASISRETFDLWKSEVQCQSQQKPSENVGHGGNGLLENSCEGNFNDNMSCNESSSTEVMDQDVADEALENSCIGEAPKNHKVISLCVNGGLDNELKESSLSKLAKFADSGHAAYSKTYVAGQLSSSFEHLLGNNNKSLKLEPVFSPSPCDDSLPVAEASPPAHHTKPNSVPGAETKDMYGAGLLTTALHTSSLSALMAMSRSDDTHSKGNQASAQKEHMGHNAQYLSRNWPATPNGPGTFSGGGTAKDDDEAFSSQRQKKMSRAEYLFVKDNPDVDSQEFSRIFPGVSARTFYRWKKEIKTQLHLA